MSQMVSTEDRFAEFIERHRIRGVSEIVDNTSKVYAGDCYKTVLTWQEKQVTIYTFVNSRSPFEHTLVSVLWMVISQAEQGGYYESYARWKQENDYGGMFTNEQQKALYQYNRQCYTRLVKFFDAERYGELARIEKGEL
jgi:hypothetical protein